MTYSIKDIRHLEIMAKLANATPIEPKKLDIKALLASDTEHKLTINEKILSLAGKLRQDGFTRQADGLESKFLDYKVASTHLYRAIDEDGEDLVNAAHPDGDNAICDADKQLGDVETIVSRHKKIIDVVNKPPTGKYGNKSSVGLQKRADVAVLDIARKFRDMCEYLKSHCLSNTPDLQETSSREYYDRLSNYYQLGLTIADELNTPAVLPEREVVQLVKNRMFNLKPIREQAPLLMSVADIDKFISDTISWCVNNNPVKQKTANKLAKYVDECKKALADTIPVSIDTLYAAATQALQNFSTVMGSISMKMERDSSDDTRYIEMLKSILDRKEVHKQSKLWGNKPFSSILLNLLDNFKSSMEPSAWNISDWFNVAREQKWKEVEPHFETLKKYADRFKNAVSQIETIENKSATEMKQREVKEWDPETAPQSVSPKDTELGKLNQWKNSPKLKTLDANLQQRVLTWIEGQSKALQEASTPEDINQIIGQNKNFEAKGLI